MLRNVKKLSGEYFLMDIKISKFVYLIACMMNTLPYC